MGGGHLILTIGALMLLLTTIMAINRGLTETDEDIVAAQTDMLAMSLTSSYLNIARGYAYDRLVDTVSYVITDPSVFTSPSSLGPDSLSEDTLSTFSDIDDLDGYSLEVQIQGSNQRYRSDFTVSYVSDSDPDVISLTQTFLKRIDVKTWRTFPAPPKSRLLDTLKASLVLSYDDLK